MTSPQEVVNMLTEMIAKAEADKTEEQRAETEYSRWCDEEVSASSAEKTRLEERYFELRSAYQSLSKEQRVSLREITSAKAEIKRLEAVTQDAMDTRAREKADYSQKHADVTAAVGQLTEAIGALTRFYENQGLLSVETEIFDAAGGPAGPIEAPPEGFGLYGKTPQGSGGAIRIMETIKSDLEEESALESQEEARTQTAYEMLVQDRHEQKQAAESKLEEKTSAYEQRYGELEGTEAEIADNTALLAAAKQKLYDRRKECTGENRNSRNSRHATRQKILQAEINALEQAKTMLTSGQVQE